MTMDFNISVDELKKEIENDNFSKGIAIWGSGSCAEQFIQNIPSIKEHIRWYIDSDCKKWGKCIDGKDIVSPEVFFERYADSTDVLFIATMYFEEILKEIKIHKYKGAIYSAFHIVFRYGQLDYRPLETHINECKGMFCDERSKYLLDFILDHRKRMDIDYNEICEPDQYFLSSIVPVVDDAVFVDGGAYHGETIDEFIKFQNGKYHKIYSFEMDKNNYKILQKRKQNANIHLLNYGLWDERTQCSYTSDETSSSLSSNQMGEDEMTAECISLDEAMGEEKVTLIKMDIEGAEKRALIGAKKCIERWKPDLAICVYHKPEDIYELTKMIHEWLPEHKLYLRHHCWNFTETVLYAINPERDLNNF